MKKITPFLWFDHQAEEAAKFYVSVFKQGGIVGVSHYPDGGPAPAGSVMTVQFQLFGQDFTALNAGPIFKFNEAISFVVRCETQREVDYYWARLSAGGRKSRCGWLKDKYGLSWQIVPTVLLDLFDSKDAAKAARVMKAMMKMSKLNIATLKKAAGKR